MSTPHVAVMGMRYLASPDTRGRALAVMHERLTALLVGDGVPEADAKAWVAKQAHLYQKDNLGVMKVAPFSEPLP